MKFHVMKIAIYENAHVEGLVPLKANPINVDGDVSLLLNSENGFSIAEVIAVIQKHFVCPACNSSIVVEAEYVPEASLKIVPAGVIDESTPVYTLDRATGNIYYQWKCNDDKGSGCTGAQNWRAGSPPVLKPELKIGGDACAGDTRSP